jgi:hypothetical protein
MERIEAVEAEINQILRTHRLLKHEQGGKVTLDQIVFKDELIADRLEERDKIHRELKESENL